MSFRNSYSELMCRVHSVNGKWEMPPAFYARLARTGQREAFDAEVERLKGDGMEHPQRWAEAAAMFPVVDKVVVAKEDGGGSGEDVVKPKVAVLSLEGDGRSLSSLLPADMLWLHRNIGADPNEDDPAPSAMAAWLWDAARSPANTSKVIDLVVKHLPPPKFMEERARMEDDGSSVLEMIDRIEGALG